MGSASFEDMSLADLLDLRDRVGRVLKARFERPLALLFTDVVGSTAYLAAHGDVAGRELLKRHHDLLERALEKTTGRVIDTAGDGAFCVADDATDGARILVRLQRLLLEDNSGLSPDDRLDVRSGLHLGPVLVDEQFVTGEAVHVAARAMGTAGAGEIRLTDPALRELPPMMRALCRRLEPQSVKGIGEPLEMVLLEWRDIARFPTHLEIVEAQRVEPLPYQGRITLGRGDGVGATNTTDIELSLPDPELSKRISRSHVELEVTADGYLLRSMSLAATEVDGKRIGKGEAVQITPGSVALLSNVLTLRFLCPPGGGDDTVLATMLES